jgi:hypothetical protein
MLMDLKTSRKLNPSLTLLTLKPKTEFLREAGTGSRAQIK